MAKLRPSMAKVWLNCAKSAKLAELLPYVETPFTEKGTRLHLVASNMIKGKYGYPRSDEDPYIDMSSRADVVAYVNFVSSLTTDIFQYEPFDAAVEEKLSLRDFLYDGNGIIDYYAYNEDDLLVIDYKTGFVRVYPDNNPQLYIYAIALLYKLEMEKNIRPKNIYVAISQPSQNNNRYVKLTRQELISWLGEQATKIEDAYFEKGGFNVGKHCQFCPARGSCVAHLRHALTSTEETEEGGETDA